MQNHIDTFLADPVSFLGAEFGRLASVALYVPNDPPLFPGFYRNLLASGIQLPGDPLARIAALGTPLARGAEWLNYPIEANILHCCDPNHLAGTHFLTVPFFRFNGARQGVNISQSGEGFYYINIERGLEIGSFEFFPFTREVTMTFRGPLVFELDTGELSILFQLIPLTEYSHIMEVGLYFTGKVNEWEKPFLPKIGEFFVRTSFAEDAAYLKQSASVNEVVFAESGHNELLETLPGLQQYRELYGNSLRNELRKASEVAKNMFW